MGRIVHRKHDPNNGDNQIDIFLDASLPSGTWNVELTTNSATPVTFHAWIERDDDRRNRFPPPRVFRNQSRFSPVDNDSTHTIGSISCGEKTIAVGSYLSGVSNFELSPFTAEGPTRDGKNKPEVSAPGQFLHPSWEWGILAASSLTQDATRMSGTSMAAPHVAGLIALIMQAADRLLSIDEIRESVMITARQNPPTPGMEWHPRYGLGRVDASAALLSQISAVPTLALIPKNVQTLESYSSNGTSSELSIANLLSIMATTAKDSKARVRIQIDVESSREVDRVP